MFVKFSAIQILVSYKQISCQKTVRLYWIRSFYFFYISIKDYNHLPKKWNDVTKQAQLRNDIIEWLHEQKVGWSSSESESLGVQFINTLSSALWEIDGNHHTLDSRGFGVPKDLAKFQGYNKPELHKKRKIGADSLVESKVSTHSVALLELSNQAYMHLKVWHNIRGCMLQLANNLRKYANYLKNQKENTATNARKISFVQSEREQWQTHNVKSLSRAEREHYGELFIMLYMMRKIFRCSA